MCDSVAPLLAVFPHAGGTASAYRRLLKWLERRVHLVIVDRPGRGARMSEALPLTMDDVISDQTECVREHLAAHFAACGQRCPRGVVLYGHSLGAVIAFEVARALAGHSVRCNRLMVSGRNAGHLPPAIGELHRRPDAALISALLSLGGTDASLARDSSLLRAVLPGVRNELRLSETYLVPPTPPLSCPITVIDAPDDPMTDSSGTAAWRELTDAAVRHRSVTGGHFGVHAHGGRLLSTLLDADLRAYGTPQTPYSPCQFPLDD
jgi:surfactin synthase thioesterase subunit